MRVLWLSHSAHVNGAELALVEGALALRERGHDVVVVLPAEGPLRARLKRVEVHIVPFAPWVVAPDRRTAVRWVAHNWLRARHRLADVARRTQRELIVSNTSVVPAGALAARLVGLPHVWCLHEFIGAGGSVRTALGRHLTLMLIGALSRAVVVCSEALQADVRCAIDGRKLFRAAYAIDVPDVSAPPPQAPPYKVVLVANRRPVKRPLDAIAALAILRRRGVDVELEMVGAAVDGYDDVIQHAARERGVASHLDITDFTEAVWPRILACHVVLICSESEGLPRVAVEAMKLGRMVVAARSPGAAEVIRDGWNGWLYAIGEVGELADRLERAFLDAEGTAQIASQARAWARDTFTMAGYGGALESAFLAALRDGERLSDVVG